MKYNSKNYNQAEINCYFQHISNNDLICVDCINATSSITSCQNFTKCKPNSILYGFCPEYLTKGSDKLSIKHYDAKPIEQMNNDELAMERFVHHGGDNIIEKGQCVDCLNSVGSSGCTILNKRPQHYQLGFEECPNRKYHK
jgi:hypothetical protein